MHGEAGQVLERIRVEGIAGTQLPDPKADVVEPDPLGEVLLVKELGVTGAEPGEYLRLPGPEYRRRPR